MTRPRLWTGEAILDHALEVAGFKAEDLTRAMQVTREAMDAETEKGNADHPTRLRASENIFGWIGLRGTRRVADGTDVTRPVQIAIVLQSGSHADAGLSPGSLRVHLTRDLEHEGNGGVRDAGRREDLGRDGRDDRSRPAPP